jgi:glutathione S-transferase
MVLDFSLCPTTLGSRQSWSPNTMKTRMVLNYKRIPYTESFISYPDIGPLMLSLSILPLPGFSIPYTLPAIISPAIPASINQFHAINDSLPIALHLEHAFSGPEYPSIFPNVGSYTVADIVGRLLVTVINLARPLIAPGVVRILDDRGATYFRETREKSFGKPLEEVAPTGTDLDATWKNIEQAFKPMIQMLHGDGGEKGPFLEGDSLSYGDILIVSFLVWVERANHENWRQMLDFGEGELQKLWDASIVWTEAMGVRKEWETSKV